LGKEMTKEEEIFKLVKQKDTGEYFPVTVYTDTRGKKRYSDGIWWFLTYGVSALSATGKPVVFEPEPESDEIVVDFGFGKCKLEIDWMKYQEARMSCPKCGKAISSGNGTYYFCSEETLVGVIEKVMYVCKCGMVLIANSDSLADLEKGRWLSERREEVTEQPNQI
jgi:hypothetical protein